MMFYVPSNVWVGTLRLLVAPTADTHKILSQTHHIFMEVWRRQFLEMLKAMPADFC